ASAVERQALLAAADEDGRTLVRVPVDRRARVDLERWEDAVRAPGVALAALQHGNGEVGTLQPVETAYAAARAAGVPLLVDAGAALGHVPVPAAWDLLVADPADWGSVAGVAVVAARSRATATAGGADPETWAPGG